MRGTFTPSSRIHPKIKSDTYKYEIDSVYFGLFCVISDNFTSRLHSCLHTMVSRSSASCIHTPLQPSPDVSMNAMHAGYPGINYAKLVGSAAASCSSCHILSTNCITSVNFSRFTHDSSLPCTKFSSVNISFAAGVPIFAWQYFPITERNFLRYILPLRIVDFKDCKIFHVCLVLVQCNFLIRQKSTLALPFFFPTGIRPYPILLPILGMEFHILLLTVVGRLCESHVGLLVIGVAGVTLIFDGRC